MSILKTLRDFFADVRRIREALERISPVTFTDPRRKSHPIGTHKEKP